MAIILPEYNARDLLAANVEVLMRANPDKGSAAKLARHCFWPSGNKKGKRVSERQIRYVLDTRPDAAPHVPSPSLDVIVAIGNAFHTPAWMLLVDQRQLRHYVMGKLFTSEDAVNDDRIRALTPAPPPPTLHEPVRKQIAAKRTRKRR